MPTQGHVPEAKGSSLVMQVFRQCLSGRILRRTKQKESLRWDFNDSYLDIVRVAGTDKHQDIYAIAPSAAFSHDGMHFAIPIEVSGLDDDSRCCIAIYDVIHDANNLLGDRREVTVPALKHAFLKSFRLQMWVDSEKMSLWKAVS